MKLKTVTIDGKTYAEVQDEKPIFVGDDGKEIAFDAPSTVATISRLNGEARDHRLGKEKAEGLLKAYEGLDANAAREAIDKLSKIDAKKLVEAGDMDAAIQAALKPHLEKLSLTEKANADLTSSLHREMVGNRFAQSKFATENLSPAGVDLIRTLYGDRLKVEDGKVFGYDANGYKIPSRARPGEPADFDEVIESLVDQYPHKDHILSGKIPPGGGAGNGGGGSSGSKTMKQADFDALGPKDRAAKMAEGFTVTP